MSLASIQFRVVDFNRIPLPNGEFIRVVIRALPGNSERDVCPEQIATAIGRICHTQDGSTATR